MRPIYLYVAIFAVLLLKGVSSQRTECPNDCSDNGVCESWNGTWTCDCDARYAKDDCSYKREEQLTAFLLELILGLFGIPGIGMIYLGQVALGVCHLLAGFLIFCGACVGGGIMLCGKGGTKSTIAGGVVIGGFACLVAVGLIAWFIIDVVRISNNSILDGNGIEMYLNL